MGRTVEAADVFEGKEKSKDILGYHKDCLHDGRQSLHTLSHDKHDTEHNGPEQNHIEEFAVRGVASEDDDIQTPFQIPIVHQVPKRLYYRVN